MPATYSLAPRFAPRVRGSEDERCRRRPARRRHLTSRRTAACEAYLLVLRLGTRCECMLQVVTRDLLAHRDAGFARETVVDPAPEPRVHDLGTQIVCGSK